MDLILILFILIVPLLAQGKVKSNYNKYSKQISSADMTGEEVAKKILEMNGISYVKVRSVPGSLSDHYNPKDKTVNLSDDVYSSNSIAAVAIAAHECGHAIQDKEAYAFLRFRSSMVPVVNFTSRVSTIFIFLGFILGLVDFIGIAILLMTAGLVFQLITLPVEFNASSRAKKQLKKCGFITKGDAKGIDKVLDAAAFTYVAGFLATAVQILRLVLISNNRR